MARSGRSPSVPPIPPAGPGAEAEAHIAQDPVTRRARAHPTRYLWALGLLTTSTSVVSSLGAPLVPTVADDFGVSLSAAQWILTASFLVGTVATPVVGRLGVDRRRRSVVLGGLVAVLLGLGLCTVPLPIGFLLAGRALQGIGIALAALALASARENLPPDRIRFALATLSVSTVVGAGIGYPVTAAIAEVAGLRGAYGFGALICATTLLVSLRWFPPARSRDVVPLDWVSVVLLGGTTLAILLAISQGHHWGWGSLPTLGLIGLAVAGALAWAVWSARAAHPLVDLRLASSGGALVANLAAVSAGVAVYLLIGLVMVQVQADPATGFGLGSSVTVAGLMLTPYALATVAGTQLARWLGRRVAVEGLLTLGLVIYLAASVTYWIAHDSVWAVAGVMALGGVGSGFTFASMPLLVVRGLPLTETSSALSFNMLLRYLGFATGSALAVTCLDAFSAHAPDATGFGAAMGVCCAFWVLALLSVLTLQGRTRLRTNPRA